MNVINKFLFENRPHLDDLAANRSSVEETLRQRIIGFLDEMPLETLVVLERSFAFGDGVYGHLYPNDLVVLMIATLSEFDLPPADRRRIKAFCGELDDFEHKAGQLAQWARPSRIQKVDVGLKEAA